jgi:hypothetical protein
MKTDGNADYESAPTLKEEIKKFDFLNLANRNRNISELFPRLNASVNTKET